jgi:hypothetical protein
VLLAVAGVTTFLVQLLNGNGHNFLDMRSGRSKAMDWSPVFAGVSVLSVFGAVACIVYARRSHRMGRVALGVLGALLSLTAFLFLPEVILLPSDVGSYWFGSQLAVGIHRAQIDTLRRRTFGSTGGTLNSTLHDNLDSGSSNVEHVWYSSGASLCENWGTLYRLVFDTQGRLQAWDSGFWWDGC